VTLVAVAAGRADTAWRMRPADTGNDDSTDEALMQAYANGDAAAFERLYARHKGPTYRYFLRHTSDRSAADELQQDVWLSVVRARERYVVDARFTTWLYTLARHRLVDHWRARRGMQFVSLDDSTDRGSLDRPLDCDPPAESPGPLDLVIDAQSGRRLQQALAEVPVEQRDAFLLHVEAGLSLAEIAGLCGEPAETIKSRLRYAYRRLRAALEDVQ
jgi:RNA polymerase sigma-70 factor (ECF subfamily)